MNRRRFIKSFTGILAASVALIFTSGCVAPRVSPTVTEKKSQAWRCENCGHLTRSDQDLTETRCPRCMRTGFMVKITEKNLQESLSE